MDTLNWQGDTRLQRSDFGIFSVIVNGCTFSTPHYVSLKMPKSNLLEVEESDSGRLGALQGAWTTCTGRTRSEQQHSRTRKQPCPDRICPCKFKVEIDKNREIGILPNKIFFGRGYPFLMFASPNVTLKKSKRNGTEMLGMRYYAKAIWCPNGARFSKTML